MDNGGEHVGFIERIEEESRVEKTVGTTGLEPVSFVTNKLQVRCSVTMEVVVTR